jgi:hypothetical protein
VKPEVSLELGEPAAEGVEFLAPVVLDLGGDLE